METKPYPTSRVIENTSKLIRRFRDEKLPVFLVRVGFLWGDTLQPVCDIPAFRASTPEWWSDFVEALDVQPSDIIITKRQWGAFYGTELDLQLRRRKIDTIVLCGIATSIGVESTARNAYELWYNQIFAEDGMSSRTDEEHHSTITHVFPRIWMVKTTEEILASF